MEVANLVEKTKWRLNRQKKLKKWVTKAFLSNLLGITQIKGGSYIQSKFSPQLRDEVLQELLRSKRPQKNTTDEELTSMKQSVLVLMSKATKQLDLDLLMSLYPFDYDFNEVLKTVSLAAPNVRQLIIHFDNLEDCFNDDSIGNTFIDYLRSLKELRILKVVGIIGNYAGIALLCEKLPNLQVLSVNRIDLKDNISEEVIKNSFGNLRLFEYGTWRISKNISKWLPQLDVVSDVRSIGLKLEDFLEDEYLPRGRKYMDLVDYNWEPNACTDFTSIRYLKCFGDKNRWNGYKMSLKLPTELDGLIISMFNDEVPDDAILVEYGANLGYLSLSGRGYENVQMNRISELCPKLEALELRTIPITQNFGHQEYFYNLRELVLVKFNWLGTSIAAVLSWFPNLRMLELEGRAYSLDDLLQVKNLIIEKKILGSLQSLHWAFCKRMQGSEFKEIAAIVKIASATLPDLRELKLSFIGCNSSFLNIAKSMRCELTRKQLICGALFSSSLIEVISAEENLIEILNLYEKFY